MLIHPPHPCNSIPKSPILFLPFFFFSLSLYLLLFFGGVGGWGRDEGEYLSIFAITKLDLWFFEFKSIKKEKVKGGNI